MALLRTTLWIDNWHPHPKTCVFALHWYPHAPPPQIHGVFVQFVLGCLFSFLFAKASQMRPSLHGWATLGVEEFWVIIWWLVTSATVCRSCQASSRRHAQAWTWSQDVRPRVTLPEIQREVGNHLFVEKKVIQGAFTGVQLDPHRWGNHTITCKNK